MVKMLLFVIVSSYSMEKDAKMLLSHPIEVLVCVEGFVWRWFLKELDRSN